MRSAVVALVRALRHPGLIMVLFCLRSLFAAAGALLWNGTFSSTWIMSLPRKDASLFQPGLLLPIRLFVEHQRDWGERARASAWLALAFITVGAIVAAFVLRAMNRHVHPGGVRRPRPAVENLACQLATVGVSWVLVLLAIYIAKQLASILPPLTYQVFGEKGADLTFVIVALVLVLAIVLIRVACDLTRAGLSHVRQPLATVAIAVATDLHARWGFWLGTYACFMLPTLGLPILAAAWFPWFGENVPNGVVGQLLAHQGVVLVSCGLQLGWWTLTLAHVQVPFESEQPEPSPHDPKEWTNS